MTIFFDAADLNDIRITAETLAHFSARENLLDAAFGAARFEKTCQRLREGRIPARGLSFSALDGGTLVGTLRFWHITAGVSPAIAGGTPVLLLGPLAVARSHRARGLGGKLIRHGLARAALLGHRAVLLVGDAPYYTRFGFTRALAGNLVLPGPVDEARFLGFEIAGGALAAARGMVRAAGAKTNVRAENLTLKKSLRRAA